MSDEFKINLEEYSEKQLKDAIKAKRQIEKFQKRPAWEQFLIIAKQNGLSITAIIALLAGGTWQKDNILRVINPPDEIINEQIQVHTLPGDVELNTRKIDSLSEKINELAADLNSLAFQVKKQRYSRRSK